MMIRRFGGGIFGPFAQPSPDLRYGGRVPAGSSSERGDTLLALAAPALLPLSLSALPQLSAAARERCVFTP